LLYKVPAEGALVQGKKKKKQRD